MNSRTPNPLLTRPEMVNLQQEVTAAFEEQARIGNVTWTDRRKTSTRDAWRKKILFETLGVDSFKEVRRADFWAIRGKFRELAGNFSGALSDYRRDGQRKSSSGSTDSNYEAELWIHKIRELLPSARDAGIGEDYLLKIARDFGGTQISHWSELHSGLLRPLFLTLSSRLKNAARP